MLLLKVLYIKKRMPRATTSRTFPWRFPLIVGQGFLWIICTFYKSKMRVPHGQERVSLWESWVGHCLHRLCLIPRPIPPPLAGPCWLPPGAPWDADDPSFWNGSNKLFLNGSGLRTCWPDHTWVIIKCAFLKQALVLRVTHLPGLWHWLWFLTEPPILLLIGSITVTLCFSSTMSYTDLTALENSIQIHNIFATGRKRDD